LKSAKQNIEDLKVRSTEVSEHCNELLRKISDLKVETEN
ncbi:hypothetical protein AVEN_241450-1, partial [Araneus ventricosus]